MPVYFKKLGEYGRLGNALFQAACTIALAKRNNDVPRFPSSWIYKDCFNIPGDYFINNINPSSTYTEPYFHYCPIPYQQNMDILGYFQSELYFKDFENEIRTIFNTKYNAEYRDGIASIHVRRDDYLKFPNHHPTLTMQYYEKAMEIVGVNKFLVFSDDIAWCKNHFIGNQFEFSEGQDAITDLSIQSKCAHNITANSSFSWWSSWLNKTPGKIVIAPNAWFGPALSTHNIKDLIPDSWIKI